MRAQLQARHLHAALAGAAITLLAAACGSTAAVGTAGRPAPAAQAQKPATYPTHVTVTASEFAYSPRTIDLKVGVPVTLTIVNAGRVDHDIKSGIPLSSLVYTKADNDADEETDNSAHNVFDVDFGTGHTSVITFTPTTAGTFAFYCDEPGHKDAGMTGNFVIH